MGTVLILLATYNGEKYIKEMIDSIIAQDYTDWRLVISDDGSTDSSADILEEYAKKLPEKITHYHSGQKFGNAQNHFMHLLENHRDAPYIMFCDQDDIWHSDKVRKTLEKMKEIEEPGTPCLVHTDLAVVDGELNKISDSFCRHSKLDGNRLKLNQLLVQNVVTGCTMMINNSLAELACEKPLPKEALMHDGWIALICSVFGKSAFLDEATIDYRQHGNNSVGAKNVTSLPYLIERFKSKAMKNSLKNAAIQAKAFLDCFGDRIPSEKRVIVEDFAKTVDCSAFKRNQIYIKHRIYKCGIIRVLAQMIWG